MQKEIKGVVKLLIYGNVVLYAESYISRLHRASIIYKYELYIEQNKLGGVSPSVQISPELATDQEIPCSPCYFNTGNYIIK